MAFKTFACNVQRAQKDAGRKCFTMFPANFVVPGTRDFIPLRSDIILGVAPASSRVLRIPWFTTHTALIIKRIYIMSPSSLSIHLILALTKITRVMPEPRHVDD
jgi:hypothetical protein